MSASLFDLYFSGQCIANAPLEAVKKNLATVFKADAARIESLFNGQTHCIKKGLDQAAAQKYQAILRKAGAVIEVRAQAATTQQTMAERLGKIASKAAPASPASNDTPPPEPENNNSEAPFEYGLTLARPGSPLLRPEERASQSTPDTKVKAPELETLESYTRLSQEPPPPPPAPDTSALSTAESYERLSEEPPPPPPAPNTDFLSVAETGSRLAPDMEALAKLDLPELDNLELSPPGADLLTEHERKKNTCTTAADTSHLSINDH